MDIRGGNAKPSLGNFTFGAIIPILGQHSVTVGAVFNSTTGKLRVVVSPIEISHPARPTERIEVAPSGLRKDGVGSRMGD